MTYPTNTLAMPGTEETGNRVHAVALVLLVRKFGFGAILNFQLGHLAVTCRS